MNMKKRRSFLKAEQLNTPITIRDDSKVKRIPNISGSTTIALGTLHPYLRQYAGASRMITVYISRRPRIMQKINTHFPTSGTDR
jgi:hypothetical protein